MMGTHIAARTERLRIGMGVSLAPFYHPLRLAEEIALLDVLSGGRVNWGAGRGFDPKEYATFGVDPAEGHARFREHVDIVLQAWRNERINYHGEHWNFDDVEVLPKPVQAPHPPVWLASSSADSVRWSAEHGYAILMDPHCSHADLAAKKQMYTQVLAESGHQPTGLPTPMARNIALGKTQAEAEAVGRAGAEFMMGSYLSPNAQQSMGMAKGVGSKGGSKGAPPPPSAVLAAADPVGQYVSDVVICGTPEKVIDDLKRYEEELPLDYLMCAPLSHESFMLFTEKVLPAFL